MHTHIVVSTRLSEYPCWSDFAACDVYLNFLCSFCREPFLYVSSSNYAYCRIDTWRFPEWPWLVIFLHLRDTKHLLRALLQLHPCRSTLKLLTKSLQEGILLVWPLVVNILFCCFLILLMASVVNLQQPFNKCVALQLTMTFHWFVDLVVFGNSFIWPSNATIGLLFLAIRSWCVVSLCRCWSLVLINTNAYLLGAAPPLLDA